MIVALGLLVAGSIILLIGLRGKQIDDHPICAKCRFDLHGLSDPNCCPECGSALNSRSIRIGHRRRSPVLIALGGLPCALIVAMLALTAWAALVGTNVDSYKPTWLLKLQVKHGIFGSRDAGVLELVNRVQAQTLPTATIGWILVDGLGMSVEPSKQIQSGDAWPYVIDFKVKNITGVSLYFYPDQIDIGPYFKPAQTGHYGSGGIGGRMASSVHVGPIEPGSYDAKMRFWFELAPGPATAPPTIGTLTLEFPQRLEIVPHDRATPIRNDSTR